jgi:hypothetical protein
MDLVVRKRTMHNQSLWCIGTGSRKDFVFYSDIYAPTVYGFKSKAEAEKIVKEIEDRLAEERYAHSELMKIYQETSKEKQ